MFEDMGFKVDQSSPIYRCFPLTVLEWKMKELRRSRGAEEELRGFSSSMREQRRRMKEVMREVEKVSREAEKPGDLIGQVSVRMDFSVGFDVLVFSNEEQQVMCGGMRAQAIPALKHRSSILDGDLGSIGPICRLRRKSSFQRINYLINWEVPYHFHEWTSELCSIDSKALYIRFI